jgi:hypothetical protein
VGSIIIFRVVMLITAGLDRRTRCNPGEAAPSSLRTWRRTSSECSSRVPLLMCSATAVELAEREREKKALLHQRTAATGKVNELKAQLAESNVSCSPLSWTDGISGNSTRHGKASPHFTRRSTNSMRNFRYSLLTRSTPWRKARG